MVQRVAAYAVVVDEGRVLLCRLAAIEGKNAGRWTLPGGGLEFGEHPEAAAIREVREETGFDVRLGPLLEVQSETFESTLGTMHAIRFLYRAEVVGGTLTNELDGTTDLVAWHTSDEAARLPTVPLAACGIELAFSKAPLPSGGEGLE